MTNTTVHFCWQLDLKTPNTFRIKLCHVIFLLLDWVNWQSHWNRYNFSKLNLLWSKLYSFSKKLENKNFTECCGTSPTQRTDKGRRIWCGFFYLLFF